MATFDIIALDADDTLWHTEELYVNAQSQFKNILARYIAADTIEDQLYQAEIRNLAHFGYGIKGFALTMIETALELTNNNIKTGDIQTLLNITKNMLTANIRLIEHVPETLTTLAASNTLMLLTKGDLYDQEMKIERSGLAHHFQHIEIVSQKHPETYQSIVAKYNTVPNRFVMVGNSLRSDILPVLDIGGHAIHIPHPLTWAHEMVESPPTDRANFHQLDHFGQLPAFLERLN